MIKNLKIFFLLLMTILFIYSCKKDENVLLIDTIEVNNYTGDGISRPNITYKFYSDKELKGSVFNLIHENKIYSVINKECKINGASKKYYCKIEFNDFFTGVDNLNRILKVYGSFLNFKKAKLLLNNREYMYLSIDRSTKIKLLLDHSIINPNDSISMNKTIPMLKWEKSK